MVKMTLKYGYFLIFTLIFTGVLLASPLLNSPISTGHNPLSPSETLRTTSQSWSNASIISDDITLWNTGESLDRTAIAVDANATLHVVWSDTTPGAWYYGGLDSEIMYASYTNSTGWSNATVISDKAPWWNDGMSINPAIAVAANGDIHVVWDDTCNGPWGTDRDIFYAKCSAGTWSNATVISDNGAWWNTGISYGSAIAVDTNGTIHVVWSDGTSTPWSNNTDTEILYVNYTAATGWSNATVISDSANWNTGTSETPQIAVDSQGTIHVVWSDETDGFWGDDVEVWHVTRTPSSGWSDATTVSNSGGGWNTGDSVTPSMIIYNDTLHLIWVDSTLGEWTNGLENEIMYATHAPSQDWSNATVISDGYNGVWWRSGLLSDPTIAVDSRGGLHVAWSDTTKAAWLSGKESEILYVHYNATTGWSNITVISDYSDWWNIDGSHHPSIAAFTPEAICIIWIDETNGWWGADSETMCAIFGVFALPSGDGVPNGEIPGFNLLYFSFALSLLGSAILFMRRFHPRTDRRFC